LAVSIFFHLLVEVVLLLRLLHLLLDARLDLAVDLELVYFDLEDAGDAVEAFERGDDLEQVLLLVDADQQMRGDGVGQLARIVDPDGGNHRVVVQVVGQLHVLLEQRDDATHRLLGVRGRLALFGEHLDDHAIEALVFLPLDRARAIDALDQDLDVAVGQLQALDDVGDAAHGEDVFGPRIVNRGIVLGGEEDALVLQQRVLERARRRRPSDDERHHHVREDDDIPQRDDREGLVHFQRVLHDVSG
jgi:hypothetical protein